MESAHGYTYLVLCAWRLQLPQSSMLFFFYDYSFFLHVRSDLVLINRRTVGEVTRGDETSLKPEVDSQWRKNGVMWISESYHSSTPKGSAFAVSKIESIQRSLFHIVTYTIVSFYVVVDRIWLKEPQFFRIEFTDIHWRIEILIIVPNY